VIEEGPEGTTGMVIVNEKVNALEIGDPVTLNVGRHVLSARHVQQPHRADRHHTAHLCAHSRSVETFPLASFSDLSSAPISRPEGEAVVHHVFLTGPALDEAVDRGRTRFLFPEDAALLAAGGELDMKSLRAAIGQHINEHLADAIASEREANLDRIERHIRTEQPEYSVLLSRKKVELSKVRWTENARQLDASLYQVQQAWDAEVRQKLAEVERKITREEASIEELAEEIERVTAEAGATGQANLARYVIKRRAVLKFVRSLLGKNALESQVHSIIFPMKKQAGEVPYHDHNLWLVDDTLAFYDFLSSDLPFNQTSAPVDSLRRPDLLAFKTGDPPYQQVALVELKRPERDDDNPVEQLVKYAIMLRKGGAKNADGVTMSGIPNHVRIDASALVTLTPALEERLRSGPANMEKTGDDWRWVGGIPRENLTIEVLDFQAFVRRAEQRNRAFFVKLGLP